LAHRALAAEEGVHDELRDGAGALRAAWQRFEAVLPAPAAGVSGARDLDGRAEQVAEQLRRDGVTHNVFDERGVASRPWSLELLPMLIEPQDWALIERGVTQRAALLEAMLADLYGPRSLLQQGLLPAALLLRHPGYLRPLHGVAPPGGQRLHIVAFDIARGPQGRWCVVAQRTQAPSGLGYVLHNRLVVSRQFPQAYRSLRVQHLASSYRRLLDTLEAHAAEIAGGSTPRVVLLTPGRYSETWFEQVYLARYLGVPLVEGSDLTVRGARLYLKTVEGLEPVHGIMRRLDDDFCDPAELRPDSALGVPGLVQAVRAGSVAMANALGSGFLESPALQGFLPGIARQLLGEELTMPSLSTWWCGEEAAWRDVRAQLDDKLIRSTFPQGGRTSQVHVLDEAAVDADPDAWTVQGRMHFSHAPIWSHGSAQTRPCMVRVYAIADGAGRWHVMPGGMTRVAPREEASMSMQRGGSSLDTWVLTEGDVDTFSMLPTRLQVDDIAKARAPVSSRTGENLFWLGRYTERTEQLVRLARSTLQQIGAGRDAPAPVLKALSALAVRTGLAPRGVPTLAQSPKLFERALLSALGDSAESFSIAFNVQAMERCAQELRERLSPEHWDLIHRMPASFSSALALPVGSLPGDAPVMQALDHLALQLAAATGAQADRMTRDFGWRLLTVGRLLERLMGLAAAMQAFLKSGALQQGLGIGLLLDLFDSAITFRARYQRHGDLLALTDVLVLDNTIPRSYAGVLRRLRTELGKLPANAQATTDWLEHLPADGAGLVLESLRGVGDLAIAAALKEVSELLADAASTLAEKLGQHYFAHADGRESVVLV
jgi:uncharacterized circularly permuted ATP-grasp superfamily protein/uncharacterized alpha-E superfamily protein